MTLFNVTLRNGPMTWHGQVEASCSEEAIMRARVQQGQVRTAFLNVWRGRIHSHDLPGFPKGVDFAAPVDS